MESALEVSSTYYLFSTRGKWLARAIPFWALRGMTKGRLCSPQIQGDFLFSTLFRSVDIYLDL